MLWQLIIYEGFKKIMVRIKKAYVNYKKSAEILNLCQTLQEYSLFIHMVRVRWMETGDLETAILKTIDTCMSQGILEEFLKKNGGDIEP